MNRWHILTGEYPPQPGGVSDYTRTVARGLAAAGDAVHVWAPPVAFGDGVDENVAVHRLPDRFGPRSLRILSRELDDDATPHRVLVQYVPHAFGWKAANLPFCLWLRSRPAGSVWVIFHEVAFPFVPGDGIARNVLAAANRVMAATVASAAARAFVSIPGWEADVRRLMGPSKPVQWLPVPSAIPVEEDRAAAAAVRARCAGARPLVGHFGTLAPAILELLRGAIRSLVLSSPANVLLIGDRSDVVCKELIARDPSFGGRVYGTGRIAPETVSAHVAACDVMLQPYPDGVSTRRTSAMVALSHGVPMVTTRGWLSEPLWDESEAAALVPVERPEALAAETVRLVEDGHARRVLGDRGRRLYDRRFASAHTIAALRHAARDAREAVPA